MPFRCFPRDRQRYDRHEDHIAAEPRPLLDADTKQPGFVHAIEAAPEQAIDFAINRRTAATGVRRPSQPDHTAINRHVIEGGGGGHAKHKEGVRGGIDPRGVWIPPPATVNPETRARRPHRSQRPITWSTSHRRQRSAAKPSPLQTPTQVPMLLPLRSPPQSHHREARDSPMSENGPVRAKQRFLATTALRCRLLPPLIWDSRQPPSLSTARRHRSSSPPRYGRLPPTRNDHMLTATGRHRHYRRGRLPPPRNNQMPNATGRHRHYHLRPSPRPSAPSASQPLPLLLPSPSQST